MFKLIGIKKYNNLGTHFALDGFKTEAMYNLLLAKGIITEAEFKAEMLKLIERTEDMKLKMEFLKHIEENY